MKFVIGVVNKDDALPLIDVLVKSEYRVTMSQTTGGFLRKENATLFTCVEDDQVEDVVRLIQENCQTRTQCMGCLPPVMESGELYVLDTDEEVEVGGAVIFVLDVAQFLKA